LRLTKTLIQAPQINPYPGKRSVVVLDNCSIHHDAEIRELIVDDCGMSYKLQIIHNLTIGSTGAHLIYLPPYSPDFNPIEEAFSAMKAWLRRNEGLMTGQEQIPWLVHQATSAITADDALGWFADCGYL
jgi:hypothetical protein